MTAHGTQTTQAAPARGSVAAAAPHWTTMAESTCVWGIWLMYAVNRLCGRWLFRTFLYPVVFYYWVANARARRASLDFLRRAHRHTGRPGKAPGLWHSLRHFMSFAETLLDKMLAMGGRYRFGEVRAEGTDLLFAQLESGRGGLIVTAHVGCLELCRALGERAGLRINILVHTLHAERFNRVLERLDPQAGVRLIQVSEISPATAVLLQEKLAAGEFLAIAGDRVPPGAGRTVQAGFLGAMARFPLGPYALASLLDCPLFAMGCVRHGKGHLMRFTELARSVKLPRANRQAALAGCAAAYAAWLEALATASPYDWFNFFDFWADGTGAGV
jgi:predicted LPLAT superfamily acyltransferase